MQSIKRRLSAFLLPLVLFGLGREASCQGDDPRFFKEWGTSGEPGSYQVWFDRRGASVWSIWLLDHFATVEARNRDFHELEDYYRLVRSVEYRLGSVQPVEPFLLLAPVPASVFQFPVPIDGGINDEGQAQAWEREDLPDGGVRFSLDGGEGLVLDKIYRPRPERREFELEIRMRATGDPGEVERTFQVYLYGLTLTNPSTENVIGNPAVAIAQQSGPSGRVRIAQPSGRGFEEFPDGGAGSPLNFAGTTNRFFGGFFYPMDEEAVRAVQKVVADSHPLADNEELGIDASSVPRVRYQLSLRVPQEQGDETSVKLVCYLGPKSFRVFGEQPEYARFEAIMDQDLSPPCFCTIPGARFMAGVLLKLLGFFQGIVVNWGAAIIMLTLLVRGLLVPLNFRMQKSMRAFGAKMARLKPEMDAMKKRHEKDPKAYQQAMMAFNKEHKIVPPIGGCLPIFLTMPVWIGLFTALRVAYDLRQQPFMLWVDDLSRPDALFEIGLSWLPYFNLLPLIMVALWYWAQASTPLPTDPQQRQMMKIMRFMPFFIGIMLYNYASGLMLYMITSSGWALVEMRITRRILGPMPTAGGIAPMTPM